MTMTTSRPRRKGNEAGEKSDSPGRPVSEAGRSGSVPDAKLSTPESTSIAEHPKSLQIYSLGIYNRVGERRELKFQLGKVNIVTGASLTGKSALISIVDYCLGRVDFIIPAGAIADCVVWYVIHIQLPNGEAVIGRPAPEGNAQSTSAAYLAVGGDLRLPVFTELIVNSNTDALIDFLTEAVGITANENVPPDGRSRRPLQANVKHARFLLFQPQTVIANDKILFYRADEAQIPQAIKDTLPYFLGATGDDQYERLQQLRRLRRELRLLERRQAEDEALRGRENSRATSLVAEAENVGMVRPGVRPEDLLAAVELLRALSNWTPAQDDTPQGNTIATLQDDRERLLEEIRNTQAEIDSARSFVAAQDGFTVEASDQRNRLSAINLYPNREDGRCPLCEHELNGAVPKAEALRASLANLELQMAGTRRQRPRLEAFVTQREDRLGDLRRRLQENKAAIEALIAQEEALQRERNRTVEQARVVGRISLFLESVRVEQEDDTLGRQMQDLRARVSTLEESLSDEIVDDRLNSILQVIGRDMSVWARQLELEYSEWPVGLDLNARNPTVVAHRETGPVRMYQMGGGKNWMGYHVVTHLALQKLFRERHRPVPGLLMLDQPTQTFYPPERVADRSVDELGDEDRRAVDRLFKLIISVTEQLAPDLQVIISDHADLDVPWFQEAVVARWRNGEKLVPVSWIDALPNAANIDDLKAEGE